MAAAMPEASMRPVAAILFLAGLVCSGGEGRRMMAVPTLPAADITAGTRVERPAFEDKAIYSGPVAQEWQREDGTPTGDPSYVKRTLHWYLRAFRGSDPAMQQLVVAVSYWNSGWIYYTRCLDSERN